MKNIYLSVVLSGFEYFLVFDFTELEIICSLYQVTADYLEVLSAVSCAMCPSKLEG